MHDAEINELELTITEDQGETPCHMDDCNATADWRLWRKQDRHLTSCTGRRYVEWCNFHKELVLNSTEIKCRKCGVVWRPVATAFESIERIR